MESQFSNSNGAGIDVGWCRGLVDQFDLWTEPTTTLRLDFACWAVLHNPLHGDFPVRHDSVGRHPFSKERLRTF